MAPIFRRFWLARIGGTFRAVVPRGSPASSTRYWDFDRLARGLCYTSRQINERAANRGIGLSGFDFHNFIAHREVTGFCAAIGAREIHNAKHSGCRPKARFTTRGKLRAFDSGFLQSAGNTQSGARRLSRNGAARFRNKDSTIWKRCKAFNAPRSRY